MPKGVDSALRRLGNAVRSFTIAQRTVAIIGIAVLVLGGIALTSWLTKPTYTPLFTGISASDANSIVDQLRSDGVTYQLTDGGSTILVPKDKVYDERLKAASAGLPTSSNGGYSLLDKMGVTSSEFQQSVTYKRAIEGELASTIEALDGVTTASVQLALPKDTVFAEQKSDPTASVFVQTAPGVNLNTQQVQAIVHLTSASITGMKPTDVSVVDSKGTVLSAVGTGTTGSDDQQAGDYEHRVQDAVQTMLDRVVGVGNSTVAVAAQVSQESAQRTEESYTTPTDAPAINESTKKESYTGSGAGTGAGVLGPDNISVPAGTDGTGNYTSETSTRNNAINKVTETRTIPAGSVTRQTVSVALDEKVAGKLNVQQVSDLVASAAGIDTQRGDQVTVKVIPFNDTGAQDAAAALKAAQKAKSADQLAQLIQTGITVGGVIVMFLLGLIGYARVRRSRREALDAGVMMIGEDGDHLGLTAGPGAGASLPSLPETPVGVDLMRSEIGALAERDPGKAAGYLRSLMEDVKQS